MVFNSPRYTALIVTNQHNWQHCVWSVPSVTPIKYQNTKIELIRLPWQHEGQSKAKYKECWVQAKIGGEGK
jgi:hypothetical protein